MAFFRAYVAPVLIVLVFLVAMLAVSVRIFLPGDMMAPAPIEDLEAPLNSDHTVSIEPDLPTLLHGVSS
jgi:hypothetical protein